MIRRVVVPRENGKEPPVVFGLTRKGVTWLAGEGAATVVAIVFAALAFSNSHDETVRRIKLTCQEANVRHREAIPKMGALITASKQTPPAQRRAQRDALQLLEEGAPLPEKGNAPEPIRTAYVQIAGFIDLFAPQYDCNKRVKQLTR